MENASDKLAEAQTAHAVNLLRVEGGMRQKALKELERLEKKLASQLLESDNLTSFQTKRFAKMHSEAKASIAATYKTIAKGTGEDLEKLAAVEAKQVKKEIGTAIGVDLGKAPMITAERVSEVVKDPNVFGYKSRDWWGKQDKNLQDQWLGTMRQGILQNETNQQLAARLTSRMTTEQLVGNSATGGNPLKTAKRNAESLVRAAVQTVANETRLKSFEDNLDLIKGVQWIATMDGRTTDVCLALSGKEWRLPDYEPVGHDKAFPGPTAHWGCRSSPNAVMRSWDELAKKPLKALDNALLEEHIEKNLKAQGKSAEFIEAAKKSTRASMDGQVAKDLSMPAFIASQGKAHANRLLGPGRAERWYAGKITLTDLTDQLNRPLTIAQLDAAVESGKPPPETEGAQFLPYEEPEPEGPTKEQIAAATTAVAAIAEGGTKAEKLALKKLQGSTDDPVELLAAVTAEAATKAELAKKADMLYKAKKQILEGKEPTAGQKAYLDDLTDEERTNFQAAIDDAKGAEAAKAEAAAAKKAQEEAEAKAAKEAKEAEAAAAKAKQEAIDVAAGTINSYADLPDDHPKKLSWEKWKESISNEGPPDPEDLPKALAGIDFEAQVIGMAQKQKAKAQLVEILEGKQTKIKKKVLEDTGLSEYEIFHHADPKALLADVETTFKAKQEQNNIQSAISQGKKKFLKGEPFTPAQQNAWDSLTSEQQDGYVNDWMAIKLAKAGQPEGDTGLDIVPPPVKPTADQIQDANVSIMLMTGIKSGSKADGLLGDLPAAELNGKAINPLWKEKPVDDDWLVTQAFMGKSDAKKETMPNQLAKVKIDDLQTVRPDVNIKSLEAYIKSGSVSSADPAKPGKPVTVVKYNGQLHLHDGDTRAVAQKFLGNTEIDALVYDLDAQTSGKVGAKPKANTPGNFKTQVSNDVDADLVTTLIGGDEAEQILAGVVAYDPIVGKNKKTLVKDAAGKVVGASHITLYDDGLAEITVAGSQPGAEFAAIADALESTKQIKADTIVIKLPSFDNLSAEDYGMKANPAGYWKVAPGDVDQAIGKLGGSLAQIKPSEAPANHAVAKAVKKTKTATKADIAVDNLDTAFPDPEDLTFIKYLDGGTKPTLNKDALGKKWVVKTPGSTPAAHVKSEATADAAYRAAGISVPASTITAKGLKVAEFVGGEELGKWSAKASKADIAAVHADIRKGFAMDALLANFDVVGTGANNILVTSELKTIRIDNGSAMTWRALGGQKPWKVDTDAFDGMRDTNVNAYGAPIFAGISDSEIKQQLADIGGRMDKIKATFGKSEAEIFEQRWQAAAKRFGVDTSDKVQKSIRNAEIFAATDPRLAKQIQDSRVNGVEIKMGSNTIEDQAALHWQEELQDGSKQTRIELKVTAAGGAKIDQAIAPLLQAANKNAPVTGGDPEFDILENAVKTVITHQADGNYNQSTIGALEKQLDVQKKKLKTAGNLDEAGLAATGLNKAKLEHYIKQGDAILAAKDAKATVTEQITPYTPPTTGEPEKVVSGIKSVNRINSLVAYQSEIVNGRAVRNATGTSYSVETGVFQIVTDDGVKIRYAPPGEPRGRKSSGATGTAFFGSVSVEAPGDATPETIAKAHRALAAMGLDVDPPSKEQKELLHLHRTVYLRKDHGMAGYKKILDDGALSDKQKVTKIKKWAEKRYDVDFQALAKAGVYDPEGSPDNFGNGYRRYKRWDITEEDLDAKLPDYVLTHTSTRDMGDALEGMLMTGGEATATTGRIRKGIGLQGGQSSGTDINTGGASYLFTRIAEKPRPGYQDMLLFKKRNLLRADAISYSGDNYGNVAQVGERAKTVAEMLSYSRNGSNETIFKNGMSLIDEIQEIHASDEKTRQRFIGIFKKHGMAILPDGRKIEDVVKTR